MRVDIFPYYEIDTIESSSTFFSMCYICYLFENPKLMLANSEDQLIVAKILCRLLQKIFKV